MKSIGSLDKNLKITTNIEKDDIAFFDIKEQPFKVYGLIYENGWTRMPDAAAQSVSRPVAELARCTAGGRVRFVTDSTYVAIKTIQPPSARFAHMSPTGQIGFDMYVGDGKKQSYVKTFIPPATVESEGGYESVIELGTSERRTVTLNFPLYYGVSELYIGLREGSLLEAADEYAISKPIVYYGSSVTQGGCANRPGNSYQGFVSRALDADFINLGFSGNAKGEPKMAEYIAGLDMSIFVYDYDYNSPTPEHLAATHEPFFNKVRAAHPTLPIIMMTRPRFNRAPEELERLEIIKQTFENARRAGDKNVYFIDGLELLHLCGNEGTVDGTHPTDFGFFSMADRLLRELKAVLK